MTQIEKVVNRLIDKGWHISCAESCTGGLVAAAIVDIPNASLVLDASIVTYANEAKIKYVDVDAATIEQFGVVSEQVAAQMAEGAARNNNAQVGVATSGVAGPTGGTAAKPVGMVCFGFYIDGAVCTYTCQFGDIGRNEVRQKSVQFVFDKLAELL